MDSDSDLPQPSSHPLSSTPLLLRSASSCPTLPLKRAHPPTLPTSRPLPIIPLLLAKTRKHEDPRHWWMSEKLDGVRCYWNGMNFMSRLGNAFQPPAYFTQHLPADISLDGELWLGRKQFNECSSIVRSSDNGKNDMSRWRKMKYMIFDAPSIAAPFEERMDFVAELIKKMKNPYIELVEQIKCTGFEHLNTELEKVERLGGEGLMLRKPGSLYEGKRSSTLLKVKSFDEAEAEVIGYEQGKGKFSNGVGALRVRFNNEKEFKIGSGLTEMDRIDPPKIGSMVTFKFQELSRDGVPRFPIFLRKYIEI